MRGREIKERTAKKKRNTAVKPYLPLGSDRRLSPHVGTSQTGIQKGKHLQNGDRCFLSPGS